jgi:hypothetical protein
MNKNEMAKGALRHLGVSWTVFDFDNENSQQAKVIRDQFQKSLDTVTEATEWSFANKSRDLPLVGDGVNGWLYEYALPADCLVLRNVGTKEYLLYPPNVPHQFLPSWVFNNSDSRILCNIEAAWGKYTRRVLENENVPNYFGRAVSAQLAYDIAPTLIGDKFAAIKNTLVAAIDLDIDRAIAYDSGRSPDNRQQMSSYELLYR